MQKIFTLIYLACVTSLAMAQPNWSAIGTGITGGSGDFVITDGSYVYIGGSLAYVDGVQCSQVARYNGTTVEDVGDPLPSSSTDVVTAMTRWNGTLLIGVVHNSTGLSQVYKLNGTAWEAIGGTFDAQIYCLEIYNNELYVGGQFSNYNGNPLRGVCKWNGTTYIDLGQTNLQVGLVHDMEVYNNELVIGMENYVLNGYRNIARYNGTAYSTFPVTFDYEVTALKTIGNKLYIGGGFLEEYTTGQELNKVAVWDGTTLSSMGTGVDGSGGVNDFTEYDGKVVAVGGFTKIGGVMTNFVASWNGTAWAKVSNENIAGSGALNSACVYNNTLFVAGGLTVGIWGKGTSVFYLKDENVSLEEEEIQAAVYPNPVQHDLMIEAKDMQQIELMDAQGNAVQKYMPVAGTEYYQISVGQLSPGVYLLRVTTTGGSTCRKIVKE